MTDPPAHDFRRYDFLFETNSVRDLARKVQSEEEWTAILSAWERKKYKTAWLPGTIAEILGTNLISQELTTATCEEIARAVTRFDKLAHRDIAPRMNDMLKWAIYNFTGGNYSYPDSEDWRDYINCAKKLKHPGQVEYTETEEEYTVAIECPEGDKLGQTIPKGFHRMQRSTKPNGSSDFENMDF